jgi:glucose-6-phosphate dehydrogenase assembly protein OpcA
MEAPMTAELPVVKPDKLLHDLADIWLALASAENSQDGGGGVLRACSMTFVVLVDEEDDAMQLGETLALLMRSHPSRAIVIRLSEAPDRLEGHVLAQCWKPFGHSQQICCEQIELIASVNRLADVPSIVSPLVVPDLPTVVWFRSTRIATAPDISGILQLGTKLIVDSAHAGSPSFGDIRTLAASGFVIGDLAWTRLTALRQLIAQLLEGRDAASVTSAVIEHCGHEAGAEARYLQAWLRSSLKSVSVDFHRNGEAGMGRIRKLSIDPDIVIAVSNSCADYESGALRHHANLSSGTEYALLDEELSIVKRDPVFERALQRMTIWTPRGF